MIESSHKEKKQLQETFTKYQKQVKKQNKRNWGIGSGLFTIAISVGLLFYFIK